MKKYLLSLGFIAGLGSIAFAAGQFPGYPIVGGAAYCSSVQNGVCVNTVPAGPTAITGNELVPADTQIAGGSPPQTVLLSMASLNALPYQYTAPLTGASVTIANNIGSLVIDPAGTIAALTVVMPAAPVDGQWLNIASSNTVTALTLTPGAGQTIAQAPTAITVSTTAPYGYRFIYRAANTKWYRLQ
jgi:hypothetical protein